MRFSFSGFLEVEVVKKHMSEKQLTAINLQSIEKSRNLTCGDRITSSDV